MRSINRGARVAVCSGLPACSNGPAGVEALAIKMSCVVAGTLVPCHEICEDSGVVMAGQRDDSLGVGIRQVRLELDELCDSRMCCSRASFAFFFFHSRLLSLVVAFLRRSREGVRKSRIPFLRCVFAGVYIKNIRAHATSISFHVK